MLNVIFYKPLETVTTETSSYDEEGNEIIITETFTFHPVKRFECETMTSGAFMFQNNKHIDCETGSMISLGDGECMFMNSSITSVSDSDDVANFFSLTNGAKMFSNCENLTTVHIKCPSLRNAKGMFAKSPIASFECEGLDSVEYADNMFEETNFSSFYNDFTSLISGDDLFLNSVSLAEFNGNLSNAESLKRAFYGTTLGSFTTNNLNKLKYGNQTFENTILSDWNINLPSLIDGTQMFKSTLLEDFKANLSQLKNGDEMFANCERLEVIQANLNSLESGVNMFKGCHLNPTSIMYIIDSLPSHSEGTHLITFGLDCENDIISLNSFADEACFIDWETLKSSLISKGWTATFETIQGEIISL